MNNIIIDAQACIGCGSCVTDCVANNIELENGKAKLLSDSCIECGHCYAVCPTKAVSMPAYDCSDCDSIGSFADFDEDEMLLAMRSRRSVRHFTARPVTEEQLRKIMEAGRYAPTATNMQNISYVVLTGNQMAEVEKECVAMFRKALKLAGVFSSAARKREIPDDFFFFRAPAAILICAEKSPKDLFGCDINGGLATAYMEIQAESMGLGVLYSGFTVINARMNRKVKKLLQLDKKQKPIACLVLGYPDIRYRRIPPRKTAKIKFLDRRNENRK